MSKGRDYSQTKVKEGNWGLIGEEWTAIVKRWSWSHRYGREGRELQANRIDSFDRTMCSVVMNSEKIRLMAL